MPRFGGVRFLEAFERSRSQLHVSPSGGTLPPVIRYDSTIRVSPVLQGSASVVEWWSPYDCEPEDEQGMDDLPASTLYAGGLAAAEAGLDRAARRSERAVGTVVDGDALQVERVLRQTPTSEVYAYRWTVSSAGLGSVVAQQHRASLHPW